MIDVERLNAEHQAEVDGLHATLIEMRDEIARLRRERNALLVGLLCAQLAPDDALIEHILDTPWKAATVAETASECVIKAGFERYLDLPSDLWTTS